MPPFRPKQDLLTNIPVRGGASQDRGPRGCTVGAPTAGSEDRRTKLSLEGRAVGVWCLAASSAASLAACRGHRRG